MKKLLALILAIIMAIGVLPVTVLAAEEYEYEEVNGTAYISISKDDRYVVSDGVDAGTIMAYVPVDLAELRMVRFAVARRCEILATAEKEHVDAIEQGGD